jgi:hypothetical protein
VEELNYVIVPFAEVQTITSVSFFAPNQDMDSFTVFIGKTTDEEYFEYCNMVPKDF